MYDAADDSCDDYQPTPKKSKTANATRPNHNKTTTNRVHEHEHSHENPTRSSNERSLIPNENSNHCDYTNDFDSHFDLLNSESE